MTEQATPAIVSALLASANRQLIDANRRAKALSGVIDRCEVHLRVALGYPDDARDAGLESLAVQVKHRFSPAGQAAGQSAGQSAEQERVIGVLSDHRPSKWQWSCTCGEMESADFKTHDAAHRVHLAEMLSVQA